jgi:hypothetical protein
MIVISNCSKNDSRKCTILDFARIKKVKKLTYLNLLAKFCGVLIGTFKNLLKLGPRLILAVAVGWV